VSAGGGAPSLAAVIAELVEGRSLGAAGARDVLATILDGAVAPEQVAGVLVALAAKGPSADELVGLLDAMAARSVRLELPAEVLARAIDVVGTGGDGASSVNVSTMAALVVAGCGVPVVKHGSRRASSTVGSADLLEALGVVLDPGPAVVARCVLEAGLGFCFAPAFHPALAAVAPVRRALGVRTVFNFLGPMANPAGVPHLLLGVSDPVLHDVMALVVAERGARHALVVRGEDGLDEVTTCATTRVLEVRTAPDGDLSIAESFLDPVAHGVPAPDAGALRGTDVAANVAALRGVLAGEEGPVRDIVVLNAAAALVAADAVPSVDEGLLAARESIDRGAAAGVLASLVALSASG